MDTGFPPPTPPSAAATVLHFVLLALAVGSIAGLFVASRRPARVSDVWLWLAAILVATVLCLAGSVESSLYRPFLIGYMLLVWAVAGAGCILSAVRLARQGRAPAVFWVLGLLVSLGLLIGLMLPAVPSAREAARRMACSNNLRQIGLALHNWHDQHGRFPDAVAGQEAGPPHSWRVALLPLLERPQLFAEYDLDHPWDGPANLPVARTPVSVYLCPSDPHDRDAENRVFTAYALVTGPGTAFPEGRGSVVGAISDGTTNTLMLAEAGGRHTVWTQPDDVDVSQVPVAINLAGEAPTRSPSMLSSYHPNGAHALMADGSVRFLGENTDPEVLKALTTAAGSEQRGGSR